MTASPKALVFARCCGLRACEACTLPGRSGWWRWVPRCRLPALALTGLALELVLLLGFLRPLSIWRHPGIVRTSRPLATVLGTDVGGALRFAVPVVAAFVAFAIAVRLAHGAAGRAATALVLLASVVFSLTLLPTNPLGAHDVYHNVADARTLWIYGDNPLLLPPSTYYPDDAFAQYVPAWRSTPSLYGPLWYLVAGTPLPAAGDALWPNVIGQKALTAAFLLTTTALTMAVAARVCPGQAAAAGVAVGWNPLLQFETAGNAHNDVVMICFTLAALYAVTRRWWVAVFPLLALAITSKYVVILLGPVLLVWLWRRNVPRRQLALSLALGVLLGVALQAPFAAGTATLRGIGREGGFLAASPQAVLHTLLWLRVHGNGLALAPVVKLIMLPVYAAVYAVLLRRVARDGGAATLVRAGFWSMFWLLVLVGGWFGPWYVMLLAPLGALLPGSRPALVAAVFSASAMLMYVPSFWLTHAGMLRYQAATAGTAFLLPVLAAVAPGRCRWVRRARD